MEEMKKHMNLLGLKVEDKVTRLKGVVTCLSFDLYGCIQAVVTPSAKENKREKSDWYDVSRLVVLEKKSVMKLPNFISGPQARGDQGCENKPIR